MARKSAIKANALAVPQTRQGAEQLVLSIGKLQRQLTRISADMNDRMATVKAAHEAKAGPIQAQIDNAFAAVHAWAEANRSTLLKKNSKTVKLGTGEIGWRTTPKSVRASRGDELVDELREKYPDAVRVTYSVNKEYILEHEEIAEAINGISISQREEFRVVPLESALECTKTQPLKEVA